MLVACLAAGGILAQGPPARSETFRARTDVVQFDVSVLDGQRLPVRGLTASDFTVLENGVPQHLAAFAEVEVPAWSPGKATWLRDVAPDVVSNRRDAQRVVVIVMDDFRTRWDPGVTQTAKNVALAAIDRLGPADLAAVVYAVSRRQGQEFTVDRTLLRAAVERFVPSGLGPRPDTKLAASNPGRGLGMPSRDVTRGPSGACMDDCVRTALRNAADILRAWPGVRKSVILISPGRYSSNPDALDFLVEGHPTRETFTALQEANINVYQFDPHGLEVEAQLSFDFGLFAEVTGGRAFRDTNAPEDLIPQIFRENSSYYLLGLQVADGARDGRFRRIEVRVNRPGVEVRTRTGYYAPSSSGSRSRPTRTPASAVDEALSGGLPAGDWPLSLTAAPFATQERPGAAVVLVARADLAEVLSANGEVEVVAVAFDERWREAGTGKVRLVPTDSRAIQSTEVALRLNLAPGRYEIRAAIGSSATERTGSAFASIAVPNFAREPLTLSGIVIGPSAGAFPLNDDLVGVVPLRPSVDRNLSPNQPTAAAVRVYQGGRRQLGPVRVEMRIVDENDRISFMGDTTLEPAAFGDKRQADYRIELPLGQLAPGEHLLTVEAMMGETSVRRNIRFSVRP